MQLKLRGKRDKINIGCSTSYSCYTVYDVNMKNFPSLIIYPELFVQKLSSNFNL